MKAFPISTPPTLILFVFLLALTGCTEVDIRPQQLSIHGTDVSTEDESARKMKEPLSVFSADGRSYDFIYDSDGRLSSINAFDQSGVIYQYVVRYDGDQFVGADLVENGQVMSSNTNFEFDKKGRIVAYDYVSFFFPDQFPDGLIEHRTLTYDKKGNLVQIGDLVLTYDQHQNIVEWGQNTFAFPGNSRPANTNPLNDIPNLWLVFVEEPGYAELMLSPHLSSSKTFSGGTTMYTHGYDDAGRLISKVGVTNGTVTERYTFSY